MHADPASTKALVDEFMGYPYGVSSREYTFVCEYLIDHHPALAAKRAGYKPSEGTTLLNRPNVRQLIMDELEKRRRVCRLDEERVFNMLCEIAFGDRREIVKWGPDGVEVVDSAALDYLQSLTVNGAKEKLTKYATTVELDMVDRMKAVELLGKLRGFFKDRVELSGKDGGPIESNSNLTPGEAYMQMLKGKQQ